MKTTYNRTMMIEDLTKAVVELHIYDNCKYTTKGRSKFVDEIYTHFEAQMQLIFSKKTQNLIYCFNDTTICCFFL